MKPITLMEGPNVALVLSEKELMAEHAELDIPYNHEWDDISPGGAITWSFEVDGIPYWIVGLSEDMDSYSTISMLVHESVHVWQGYRDFIQERKPGIEFEAYAIQGIHSALMTQFASSKVGKARMKAW